MDQVYKYLLLLVSSVIMSEASQVMATSGKDAIFVFPLDHVSVHVYNNLEPGLNLDVHCKSKDDDLGLHTVPFNESFQWKFTVNARQTTLFFCGLTWRDGSGIYDIYVAKRDHPRCAKNCVWRTQKFGIFGYKEGWTVEDIMYLWTKNSSTWL